MKTQRYSLMILIGLVIIFFTTSPKISAKLFPFKRQQVLSNFIQSTTANRRLNAQEFWKFREFYYPGHIKFDKRGYSQEDIAPYLDRIDIPIDSQAATYPFLIYESDRMTSVEYLVKKDKLNQLIGELNLKKKDIIWQDPTSHIYRDGNDVKIIFLKTDDEMVLANGFLSPLNKEDVPIYEGKYWFVVSSVALN